MAFAKSRSNDKKTVAHEFRGGVAELFINYFTYLKLLQSSPDSQQALEIIIVTRARSEFVKLMLAQLLIEKNVITESQRDDLPENIQFFMNNIKTTWDRDHLNRELLHRSGERHKVNVITKVLRDRKRTGTSADFFFDDSTQEIQHFNKNRTPETVNMTIGDENAFSGRLDAMNKLIRGELSPNTTTNGTVPNSKESKTTYETTSTCAEFFKKKQTEFIAFGMFGAISSLGTLAYLQYGGQDGMRFLDGLKDIPNNPSTLSLAIVGGVCIVALIATAVAACCSGSNTAYNQLGNTGGGA